MGSIDDEPLQKIGPGVILGVDFSCADLEGVRRAIQVDQPPGVGVLLIHDG